MILVRAPILLSILLAVMLVGRGGDARAQTPPGGEEILYLHEADAAIKAGRYSQAGILLEWLAKNGSETIADDIYLLRAEYLMVHGQIKPASIMLGNSRDTGRNICRRQSLEGWIASSNGETNMAIVKLADATTRCPSNIGAWNLLGLALTEKGEIAAARAAFQRALEAAPEDAGLLNNLALVEIASENLDRAADLLEGAKAFSPDNPAILANFDYVAAMQGHQPERRSGDSDQYWAERLLHAAEGAKKARDSKLAMAMFSRAVLLLDQYDERAWRLASGQAEKDE